AVESVPARKELARTYGAHEVVDFTEDDPVEAILELTDGRGVDSAIEALGAQETFGACIKATRPGGTISNIGYHGEGDYVKIPRAEWGVGMSDQTIRTALCPGGSVRMARLLRVIDQGLVDPTPMTTHRFDFDELEHAFDLMETKAEGIIKPLIRFA
ncbi:MAG: zinc-binding dehydrogenase, partial [Longimicrobiales bacterium]